MARIWVDKNKYEDLCLMEQFIEDNGLVLQYEMFVDVLIQMGNHPSLKPQTQIIDLEDERGN
jgi:hypothetical protein